MPAYDEIVQSNARRWEAMAVHRRGMTIDQHRSGEIALDDLELELLGDLSGIRVLHLACSTSDEGIAMALRGASVIGVDISPTHVRIGQEKAKALRADVSLRVGNMMSLDPALSDFDVVYISTGGLCWVPDLDDWLVGVRGALKPGGRLLIAEHHPIWETLGVAGDRRMTVLRDYFDRRDLPPITDEAKRAIGARQTDDSDDTLHSYVWGIGALVTALLDAGFSVTALHELPYPDMYDGLGEAADCVPAVYRLRATRL